MGKKILQDIKIVLDNGEEITFKTFAELKSFISKLVNK